MATEEVNKPPSSLTPYSEMIIAAISTVGDQEGCTKSEISKYIELRLDDLPEGHSTLLSHHLNSMRESGEVVLVKNNYMVPNHSQGDYVAPKRGRGRPPKTKNLIADSVDDLPLAQCAPYPELEPLSSFSSQMPVHRGRGRPKGSRNKNKVNAGEVGEADGERTRGVNYSIVEDELLTKAWIAMAEGSFTSDDQSDAKYWERVCSEYHMMVKGNHPKRPYESLRKRFTNISKYCAQYITVLRSVKLTYPSDISREDEIEKINREYALLYNSNFLHLGCYEMLKKCEKWMAQSEKWMPLSGSNPKKAKRPKKMHLNPPETVSETLSVQDGSSALEALVYFNEDQDDISAQPHSHYLEHPEPFPSVTPTRKTRGRPRGSRNKPKVFAGVGEAYEEKDRGANFTIEEDKLLTKSWIEITSNEQVDTSFWESVGSKYHTLKEDSHPKRSNESLRKRFTYISKVCGRYISVRQSIELEYSCDISIIDKINRVYYELHHSNFLHQGCYEMLKQCEKWMPGCGSNSSTPKRPKKAHLSDSVSETPSTQNGTSALETPVYFDEEQEDNDPHQYVRLEGKAVNAMRKVDQRAELFLETREMNQSFNKETSVYMPKFSEEVASYKPTLTSEEMDLEKSRVRIMLLEQEAKKAEREERIMKEKFTEDMTPEYVNWLRREKARILAAAD
ncbi:hypothetical protein GIB67_000091 [Kingdonia uniflora]|uniref:H15 domain-containing protein n=1 Tax=Kingdonia uniflora TaxID=39325 RepID=A0A7J7M5R2_9MAGN|nr:hypothetical protein GIB67_000091 [Kingdonia uniflora]